MKRSKSGGHIVPHIYFIHSLKMRQDISTILLRSMPLHRWGVIQISIWLWVSNFKFFFSRFWFGVLIFGFSFFFFFCYTSLPVLLLLPERCLCVKQKKKKKIHRISLSPSHQREVSKYANLDFLFFIFREKSGNIK